MIPLPPFDPALPSLGLALDGAAMAERLSGALAGCRSGELAVESCEPVYVRYKPATSCLVQYVVGIRETGTDAAPGIKAYARLQPDRAAAVQSGRASLRRLVDRARRHHADGPMARAAYLADLGAMFFLFPVDRRLRGLVRATAVRGARRALRSIDAEAADLQVSDVELVRYRPERKALLRYALRSAPWPGLYAKLYADARQGRVFEAMRAARAAGAPTAAPIAALDGPSMLLQEEVPGIRLATLRGTSAYARHLEAVAAALERLHAALPAARDTVPAADERTLVLAASHAVGRLCPDLGARATTLAGAIVDRIGSVAGRPALVHGDFYDDQVLVTSRGACIVDLDDAAFGEPLTDIGTFLAHLSARYGGAGGEAARDAFLTAAATHDRRVASHAPLFEAAALLKLAVGPFRRLEADWQDGVARILALAEQRLREHRPVADAGRRAPSSMGAEEEWPQIGVLTDHDVMGRLLSDALAAPVHVSEIEPIRHKPGRRCLLRYRLEVCRDGATEVRVVYAKAFASGRGPHVLAALEALHAATSGAGGPLVPEPLGYLDDLQVLLLAELPGDPVEPRLLAGDGAVAQDVATALYRLHHSRALLPRRHGLERELAPLPERVASLSGKLPELAPAAHACLVLALRGASRPWAWRWLPLHRDCHPDQVLVAVGRVAFVDLDDAATGEPAVDVANLMAHVRLLAIRHPGAAEAVMSAHGAIRSRYEQLDPDIDPALVSFLEGTTLLRLAEIHGTARGGAELAANLLEEAECLLEPTA